MELQARIDSLRAGNGIWRPPKPQRAATVVLVNQGEVLLMRRAATMTFAPGMYVFPGGRVNNADRESPDPVQACARRETWEEVAIQLDDCTLVDRWVTPEFESTRFDVSFYLSHTQSRGRIANREADVITWVSPRAAVERSHLGEMPMLRPTLHVLTTLAHEIPESTPASDGDVAPKLPRLQADGTWNIVHAETGQVLQRSVTGPKRAETSGGTIR